jgi:hypothetical protein
MHRQFILLVVGIVVAFPTSTAFGRLIEDWPYERLFKEADLVIIATAEQSAETKDRLKTDWKVDFLGLNTTFMVQSTLKGKAKANIITVLHFRPPEGVTLEDGPLLVSIRSEQPFVKGERKRATSRPEYFLFLRARADGRYEPVSGQIDPALSVREMQSPESFLVQKDRK